MPELFRFRPNRLLQQKGPALVGEVFEADSSARASAGQVLGQTSVEVFRRDEFSRIGLNFGGDEGMVTLRQWTELVPIEPRRGDFTNVCQMARAKRRHGEEF